jgi:hypothetical protein
MHDDLGDTRLHVCCVRSANLGEELTTLSIVLWPKLTNVTDGQNERTYARKQLNYMVTRCV